MKKTSAVVLLFLFASVALKAENASAANNTAAQITLGQSIVALNGPWKFHTGDDMRWADPKFDDSGWETVDLTPQAGSVDPIGGIPGYVPGWTAKGHPGYWGWAWYRIRVQVAGWTGENLALAGPTDVDDGYQVFDNGTLVGSFGKFRGPGLRPIIYETVPKMFLLSQTATNGGDSTEPATHVFAFRVWMEPNTLTFDPDAGGIHTPPMLGETSMVTARNHLAWFELVRSWASVAVVAVLFFLLAVLACSLVLFDRSDPVYVWLAAVFLLTALYNFFLCLAAWTQFTAGEDWNLIEDVLLHPLTLGGWVMVWWVWFRLRNPAWIPKSIAGLTLLYMLSEALGENLFVTVVSHPVSAAFHLASLGIRLLFLLLLVLIVFRGIRQQGREGWLALPAVVLMGISLFQRELGILRVRVVWFPFGTQASLESIASVALAAAIFVLLLRRLLLSLRQQREMALDVKQAQEVQQVLIPEELPQVPGLTIESEYRPAREVGGDFFQIIPHPSDGSVLIVVGDVTGHGLQAGMLVALIVGAIRAEAAHSNDPLSALNALNQRLCGRGQAHATGLALRIALDGSATLANAGHLPPYLNGKELPMEGALPLGMLESAEFSVMHFQLAPGDTLMLMSDGVVEAQDEQGQLFGFKRISEMLQHPITAAEVAATAQAFGQEDDISVLSVTRMTNLKTVLT
ncbi:MAG TPA: SpoIIE family protein phosphatase [Acidobacteriaceae bacterium]|nr:SpoIIE family protein phosphatase [Acidobacteriaceae bacterium]